MIYLDNSATTRPFAKVVSRMNYYLREKYGNPSSPYQFGLMARKDVETARNQIAKTLGCESDEIIFTSGGTESDNLAIRMVANMYRNQTIHIITTQIEHAAVLNTLKSLECEKVMVTYLPVAKNGRVDIEKIRQAVRPQTVLITIMAANNEIGTIMPIEEIGAFAKEKGILFHTDAVQMYGHLPMDVNKMHIDLLSASAHKFHGPKGTGFLYIGKKLRRNTFLGGEYREMLLEPMITGGGQEGNLRSGTEAVPQIMGMELAARMCMDSMEETIGALSKKRKWLYRHLQEQMPEIWMNGDEKFRLPGHLSITIPGINAGELIAFLDLRGICCSKGSACGSGHGKVSHVLTAIGLNEDEAKATIRLCIGEDVSDKELWYVASQIIEITRNYWR